MHPFGTALEAGDARAAAALLADDVVFSSPIVFRPYTGRAAPAAAIAAAARVLDDFAYEKELSSADGRDHALVFRARVGEKEIEGCDFVHVGDDGLIDELTVMVRPLSAALAFREAMAAELAEPSRP